MGLLDGLENMTPAQQGMLGMGLGMMGQRGSFGQAMGNGGLNGMAMMQQAQALKRKQALEDLQMEKYRYDLGKSRAQDAREAQFRSALPGIDIKDKNALSKALFDLELYDEAIKLQTRGGVLGSGGDYQFIAGPNGQLMVGNKDTGALDWGKIGGEQAKMATYDPVTQGNVQIAKQNNTYGDYTTPSGATVPMLKGQAAPQRKQFEFNDPQSLSDFVNSPEGRAIMGQPLIGTAGDKKYAEEKGKDKAEQEKEDANIVKKAERQESLLNDAETLLPQATNGGAESIYNDVNKFFGRSTPATRADVQLEKIANDLTSEIKRAPGDQSEKELDFAIAQAGKLGDRSTPVDDRVAALKYLKKRQQYLSKGYNNAADVLMQQNSQAKPAGKIKFMGFE